MNHEKETQKMAYRRTRRTASGYRRASSRTRTNRRTGRRSGNRRTGGAQTLRIVIESPTVGARGPLSIQKPVKDGKAKF